VTKKYSGVEGKPVGWTLDKTPQNGRMDLYKYDPYEMVVVYAATYIHSPVAQTVPLLLGSDDGVKVFLNGKEIHRFLAIRVARPTRTPCRWNCTADEHADAEDREQLRRIQLLCQSP